MRELKRLFICVLILTFFGGAGTGAWIGTLMAAPEPTPPDVDRRVDDWKAAFPDLTAAQVRMIRRLIAEHDKKVDSVRAELTARQFTSLLEIHERFRDRIREVLSPTQRTEYDKRLGRK